LLRIGVVGCGGADRSHVRDYLENGVSARDVYICDVEESRAIEVAKEFRVLMENVFHGDKCHLDFIRKN